LREEYEHGWYRLEEGRQKIVPVGFDNWGNLRVLQDRLSKKYSGEELERAMRAQIDVWIDREVASEAAKVQHDRHRKLKMLF
jgi:hypothetical protein